MLKAIIIDNEMRSIVAIRQTIEEYCPEVNVADAYTGLEEALKGIRTLQPDLIFLDVELDNGVTGFDVLEKIPNRHFEVIFVTGYDKYAVRAFQFSALHYLVKPIDGDLLCEAIERVKRKRSENEFREQLQVLTESLKNASAVPKQIILPNPKQGDSIVVPVSDVIRVEASGSQAIFYFRWQGKIEKSMYSLNIGALQKKMLQGNDDFIMIHESHIVNRNHITHYNPKSHAVQMADETFIRIAARRISDFLEKFNQ